MQMYVHHALKANEWRSSHKLVFIKAKKTFLDDVGKTSKVLSKF